MSAVTSQDLDIDFNFNEWLIRNQLQFKQFVSNEEQQIIDSIQNNLKLLNKKEKELNNLTNEYPKSLERIKNNKLKKIETVQIKINTVFKQLHNTLNSKKQNVLKEINILKNDIINDKIDNKQNDFHQKQKEKNLYSIKKCKQQIKDTRELLIKSESIYNKSSIKQNIIIGNNIINKIDKTNKILKTNINILSQSIIKNNKIDVNIDYIVNNKQYQNIANCFNEFGRIIHNINICNNDNNDIDINTDKEALRLWFQKTVKLPQYFELFYDDGYEDLSYFDEDIVEDDLVAVGIKNSLHREIIMDAIFKLLKSNIKDNKDDTEFDIINSYVKSDIDKKQQP